MHMHTLLFLFLLLWYHKAMKHGTYMSVSMVILSFRHLNELSPKHQN